MDKKRIGEAGEELAAALLEGKGYSIVLRNYRCKYGEIDIIAVKSDVLCFVEVKTRTSDRFGTGREAVDKEKRIHIRKCAEHYMKTVGTVSDFAEFQVIEISLEHIKGLSF